jgi:hypothetical protein
MFRNQVKSQLDTPLVPQSTDFIESGFLSLSSRGGQPPTSVGVPATRASTAHTGPPGWLVRVLRYHYSLQYCTSVQSTDSGGRHGSQTPQRRTLVAPRAKHVFPWKPRIRSGNGQVVVRVSTDRLACMEDRLATTKHGPRQRLIAAVIDPVRASSSMISSPVGRRAAGLRRMQRRELVEV